MMEYVNQLEDSSATQTWGKSLQFIASFTKDSQKFKQLSLIVKRQVKYSLTSRRQNIKFIQLQLQPECHKAVLTVSLIYCSVTWFV